MSDEPDANLALGAVKFVDLAAVLPGDSFVRVIFAVGVVDVDDRCASIEKEIHCRLHA